MQLAPSILSADFACLADSVALVEPESDLLHVDVMDGHFVPNLTIGPAVVAALARHTALPLDCHLMVTRPEELLGAFVQAGASGITVHVEIGRTAELIDAIRAVGVRVGLSLNPPTPYAAVQPFLDRIDLLLVMSVNPGWGGQSFIPESLDKVRAARDEIDARGLACEIEIDGGINLDTAPLALAAGADILVAGSAVFGAADPRAAAAELHRVRAGGVTADDHAGPALRAKVLTCSDGVVVGTRDDASGRALVARLGEAGYDVVEHRVSPDGVDEVAGALRDLVDGFAGLVVTTGGTGFGPRDLTPEATRAVVERDAPGLSEAMRWDTFGRFPHGMLSRGVSGSVGAALIVNLPGSPKGAVESLEVVLPALGHALELLAGGRPH